MRPAGALSIRTPEGIDFNLPLAGPVARCLALAIDAAVVGAATSLVGGLLGGLAVIGFDLAVAVTIYASFACALGYGMALEWFWRGQTVGKRLLGLRVIDAENLRLHFSQIAIRNLLRVVDVLPASYMVGGMAMFFSARAQRLGDVAANTVVVRLPREARPDAEAALAAPFNSLRDHPIPAARLRQRVTPALAGILVRAVLRRDRLEPEGRVALFADLARHLRALAPFPPEATEGMSDEQYVRGALDIVLRR